MEIFRTIATIFLILLNGFFVAAEFAIVKVRSTQLDNPENDVSQRRLLAAKKVTGNLDNYLAATQLGITIASLALGWVGEEVMTKGILKLFHLLHISTSESTAHQWAVPLAFIAITILHIVFGELAPKSIAIRKATETTFWIAIPLRGFYYVTRPFIWVLNSITNVILKIIGIDPVKEQDIHTEEEIKLIISESGNSGAIEDSERELINNVFDFDSLRVKEILVHRKDIAALDIAKPFGELIQTIISEGYSRYPVYKESLNDILGILFIKDIIPLLEAHKEINVKQILRPVFYIPDSMKIKDLLKSFQKDHLQMAVVTDEYGDIAGIVTMEDILEELVGDIQDEHDAEQPIVEAQVDGSYLVLAHETIDDLNEFLPLPLPTDDHYSTLSGLITYKHGSVPVEGETLQMGGYDMMILKMYRSSVERVRLQVSDVEDDNEEEDD